MKCGSRVHVEDIQNGVYAVYYIISRPKQFGSYSKSIQDPSKSCPKSVQNLILNHRNRIQEGIQNSIEISSRIHAKFNLKLSKFHPKPIQIPCKIRPKSIPNRRPRKGWDSLYVWIKNGYFLGCFLGPFWLEKVFGNPREGPGGAQMELKVSKSAYQNRCKNQRLKKTGKVCERAPKMMPKWIPRACIFHTFQGKVVLSKSSFS